MQASGAVVSMIPHRNILCNGTLLSSRHEVRGGALIPKTNPEPCQRGAAPSIAHCGMSHAVLLVLLVRSPPSLPSSAIFPP